MTKLVNEDYNFLLYMWSSMDMAGLGLNKIGRLSDTKEGH